MWEVGAEGDVRALRPAESYASLEDVLPLGTYTGLRAYDGRRILRPELHFARLRECSANLGLACPAESTLRRALGSVLDSSPDCDLFVRVDILSGPATAIESERFVLIGLAPIAPTPRFIEEGVGLGWAEGFVREQPQVKDGAWIVNRRPFPERTLEANDHLLADEQGRILEGTSCNFFGVRGGAILTAGDGILNGVTRRIVIDVARSADITVESRRIPRNEVSTLDEAFVTSSTRPIFPVTRIGTEVVGVGSPGRVTRRIMQDYAELVRREAKSLSPS